MVIFPIIKLLARYLYWIPLGAVLNIHVFKVAQKLERGKVIFFPAVLPGCTDNNLLLPFKSFIYGNFQMYVYFKK